MFNGKCTKCPKRSDIKECNNACGLGYNLVGEDCVPICTLANEKFSYGICVCVEGFYRIGGKCLACE